MKHSIKNVRLGLTCRLAGVAAIALAACQSAHAGFADYVIRGTPAPTINTPAPGQTEFIISVSGQKAGLGSNDINGHTLGDIASLKISRLDDVSRFPAGSGPAFAPYLNFWITDGTHFAVVANEPTDPAFQSLYNNGWALDFSDLSNKVAKIYENTDQSWLPNNGVGLTFSDLSSYMIGAPTVAELTTGWTGLTNGAPRTLGSNVAYGVNWIFGDTLTNYVSGDPGYLVSDASVTATPEPGTSALMLGALGALGLVSRRRKFQQQRA